MDIAFYTILIISCLFVLNSKGENKYSPYWYWVVVLIIFCAIRDPMSLRDMPNYLSYFYTGSYVTTVTTENVNIGYELLTKVSKTIIESFFFFTCVTTIFITGTWAWFCRKHSVKPYLALFIFVLVLYFPTFFLLRQSLAVAASTIAFDGLLTDKWKRFLIWSVIAISFHTTAAIIIPMWLLYKMPLNKRTVIFLIIGALITTSGLNVIATRFLSYSEYYSNYLNTDYEASFSRLLMKITFLGIVFYAFKDKIYNKGVYYFIFLCALLETVIYYGSSGIDGVFRLKMYFDVGEVLGIPLLIHECITLIGNKRFIIKSITILYILFSVYSCYLYLTNGNFEYGYQSIFS